MPGNVNLTPSPAWRPTLESTLLTLRQLSGSTEKDFLHLGTKMQNAYAHATELSQIARQLVEVASGDHISALMEQLRNILSEMTLSLEHANNRTLNNYNQINQIGTILSQLSQPVEDFRRMAKQLYIFEVLIRIESTYIKESGAEFINLAADIRKLSSQIKSETSDIKSNIDILLSTVSSHSTFINKEVSKGEERSINAINNTENSILQLNNIHNKYIEHASSIDFISTKTSENISTIVQSIQIHDSYRQQVEHVIDSIEELVVSFEKTGENQNNECIELIRTVGDVCEIQHAQLNLASKTLYESVELIINELIKMHKSQSEISKFSSNSIVNQKETSFLSDVTSNITSVTNLIHEYSRTAVTMDEMMNNVLSTMEDITSFVHNVELFGSEIIQIALNARIKSVATGQDGAAMSSLSDEVGQLSKSAVHRTEIISQALGKIQHIIETIANDTGAEHGNFSRNFKNMQDHLQQLFKGLELVGAELNRLIKLMHCQDAALAQEIKQITTEIDVHKRIQQMTHTVLNNLKDIFTSARNLYPADETFKKELVNLAARYTMESERLVHMEIAKKNGTLVINKSDEINKPQKNITEFGDNVDLF